MMKLNIMMNNLSVILMDFKLNNFKKFYKIKLLFKDLDQKLEN
jgi:hypothetical protein